MTETDARTALLDAAERVILRGGYPAATNRAVASEAGLNHGLVAYYFGSIEQLLVETLRRLTGLLYERQRALYGSDRPFLDKWREAMDHLTGTDQDYGRLWLELQAMSWTRPELRSLVSDVNEGWRAVLRDAIGAALAELGIDEERFPTEAMVTLVMTFNLGVQVERAGGVTTGHLDLLEMIDRFLVDRTTDPADGGSTATTQEQNS